MAGSDHVVADPAVLDAARRRSRARAERLEHEPAPGRHRVADIDGLTFDMLAELARSQVVADREQRDGQTVALAALLRLCADAWQITQGEALRQLESAGVVSVYVRWGRLERALRERGSGEAG